VRKARVVTLGHCSLSARFPYAILQPLAGVLMVLTKVSLFLTVPPEVLELLVSVRFRAFRSVYPCLIVNILLQRKVH